MPERIFKYFSTKDLIEQVTELGQTLASDAGAINQVRNSQSGFLTVSAGVNQKQLHDKYRLGRWEIFLRGQGVDGNDPDAKCSALEPTDPLRERTMKIRTVYGWPFPYQVAPTVN